jgi:hypothetical protein
MADRKKADGPTWALRVGLVIALVAVLQACNEATRPAYQDYRSATRTAALAVVFVLAAFGARAWQAMSRGSSEPED